MKAQELHELSVPELRQKEQQLWEELFNLKMRHALRALENPIKLRLIRRDIARVKTILRQKELSGTEGT